MLSVSGHARYRAWSQSIRMLGVSGHARYRAWPQSLLFRRHDHIPRPMKIIILATGGTFDKIYYDALSDYRIGEPQAGAMLEMARVSFDYAVEAVVSKDSLDMDDADRQLLRRRIENDDGHRHFVITHGTDTMADTAAALRGIAGKTVVLTGAASPARFRDSDAVFNTGFALAAVQLLAPGVYVAMNGVVFEAGKVAKNPATGYFEAHPAP